MKTSLGHHGIEHDGVIKWRYFPRYWPFVRGIHRSPVNSPHKGQWRGALMFSLICVSINGWVNNRKAGDLRRHRTHYDVIVMKYFYYWPFMMGIHRPPVYSPHKGATVMWSFASNFNGNKEPVMQDDFLCTLDKLVKIELPVIWENMIMWRHVWCIGEHFYATEVKRIL